MDKSRDGNHSSKEFTEVINRNIKVGHEKDYDEWLRRFMKLESEVPGYLGTTIIAPGGSSSSVRYVINRFADKSSLDSWESSEVAHKLNSRSEHLLYLRKSDWSGDVVCSA